MCPNNTPLLRFHRRRIQQRYREKKKRQNPFHVILLAAILCSAFRFIPPAVPQVGSNTVLATRLGDVPALQPFPQVSHFSSALRFTCSLRPILPPLRRPLSYSLQVSSFRGVHYNLLPSYAAQAHFSGTML